MTQADFPAGISPFPGTGDQRYDHRGALCPPPYTGVRSLQKLRPIRASGRDSTGHEYDQKISFDDCLLEKGAIAGTLTDGHGMAVAAVTQDEFLSPQPLQKLRPFKRSCGEITERCDSPASVQEAELLEKRADFENRWPPAETLALMKIRPDMDDFLGNAKPKGVLSEILSSSSSGDDCYANDDSLEDVTEPVSQKRKRKTKKKLEVFLENLVDKVMRKQEEMHKQLMDMLEKREEDRIVREEAWKRQTLEKMKKDEELRTQETSRNLALISFIQNFLGQEISIPKSLQIQTSCQEEDDHEKHDHAELKADPRNKRWPRSEVQALITYRIAMEHKFHGISPKSPIWEEISTAMSSMGYNRTAKKCKEKWENINKYFKRTVGSGNKRPKNANTCQYFQELDILYKSGLTSPVNASTETISEVEDTSAKEEMLTALASTQGSSFM